MAPIIDRVMMTSFVGAAQYFGTTIRNLTRGISYRLGIPKGVSLAMYRNEQTGAGRPKNHKVKDMVLLGVLLGGINAGLTWYNNAHQVDLSNLITASAVSFAVQFVWGSYEPANSALKTWAMKYDHRSKTIRPSSTWTYLMQFVFSLPSSLGVQWALGGNMSHALLNAAIATFARKPLTELVGKHQDSGKGHFHADGSKKLSRDETRWWNLGTGALLAIVKIAHLAGGDLGTIFVAMGGAGVAIEIYKHYTYKLQVPKVLTWLSSEGIHQFKNFFREVGKRIGKDFSVVMDRMGILPLDACSTKLYLLKPGRFEEIRSLASHR